MYNFGIIGAGTMGQGIAQLLITHNYNVVLYDTNTSALTIAKEKIQTQIQRLEDKKKISDGNKCMSLLQTSGDFTSLKQIDVAIEAVVENIQIKQEIFIKLEKICSTKALLCTNTSTISISAIASVLKDPSRLIGLHFFNPAPVMKLVEVVLGLKTSKIIQEQATTLALNIGKEVVISNSSPGFIVNRIARPFYAESLELAETSNLYPAKIDSILTSGLNFKMGPFALMDLIGNDVNYKNTASVFESMYFDKRFKPSLLQKEYVDAKLYGRKTNIGFYQYPLKASDYTQEKTLNAPKIDTILVYEGTKANPLFENLIAAVSKQYKLTKIFCSELEDTSISYLKVKDTICVIHDGLLFKQKNIFYLDWSADYGQPQTLTYFHFDEQKYEINALFSSLNIRLTSLPYMPGLVNARVLSMLINEAADCVWYQVCSPVDADKAVTFGLNYPKGLLKWGEEIGFNYLASIINSMADFYKLERYRLSPWISQQIIKQRYEK